LGVEPNQVIEAVERLVGHGQQAPSHPPIMVPRMVQVVEFGVEEKKLLAHPALGTGHLLLGLVREGQGMAITILRSLNIDPEQIRMKTLEMM
jgi:ATP-dependent Clp protease ATP-binding subunit ClpC